MRRASRRPRLAATAGPAISGERLALRPLREEDVAALAPWSADADDLIRRLMEARPEPDANLLAIVRREDGRAIGVLAYRVDDPGDGWLTFGLVAVEPALRGLGLDAEAVRLVEEDALDRGLARRFRAGVDREDGPGLYFWLRLGYLPARAEDNPWSGERASCTIALMRADGD